MSDEIPAKRLAEWLTSPPGTAPPDGMDPDVLATVWTLVPDRAPAPRVSLDDILSGIESGPFATLAPTTGTLIGFPSPAEAGSARAAAEPKRRPSRVWWAAPALGISLAAAAATLLVLPMAAKLLAPDLVATEERLAAAQPTSPPEPASPPEPGAAAGIPELAAPAAAPQAPVGGAPPALERAKDAPLDVPLNAVRNRTALAAPAAGEGGATRQEDAADEGAASGYGAVSRSGGAKGGDVADEVGVSEAAPEAASEARGKEKDSGRASSTRALPSTSSPPASPTRAASIPESERDEDALSDDWRDVAELRSTGASAPKPRADKSTAAGPPVTPAPAAPAPVAAESPPPPPPASGSTSSASSTAPLDYSAEWYRAVPDVVAAYTAARSDEAAGRWDAAANRWKTLMAHSRADVAQDAALRAAKALRSAGRANEALAAVDQGLRRSGSNTPFRASLLGLRAELLAELGRASDANNALDELKESNEAR